MKRRGKSQANADEEAVASSVGLKKPLVSEGVGKQAGAQTGGRRRSSLNQEELDKMAAKRRPPQVEVKKEHGESDGEGKAKIPPRKKTKRKVEEAEESDDGKMGMEEEGDSEEEGGGDDEEDEVEDDEEDDDDDEEDEDGEEVCDDAECVSCKAKLAGRDPVEQALKKKGKWKMKVGRRRMAPERTRYVDLCAYCFWAWKKKKPLLTKRGWQGWSALHLTTLLIWL